MRCDGCDVVNYKPPNLIPCPTNATVIHFRDTVMESMPVALFVAYSSLQVLDASSSNLESITNMTFDKLQKLNNLDLSNNSIQTIPAEIFSNCNAVEVNFQRNRISRLRSESFNGLTKLVELDLSYNQLEHLDEDVFRPLVSMKTLRLDFNKIGVIDNLLFARNSMLQMLYLNNNQISFIADKAFEELKHLNALEIGNNSFATINLMPLERMRTFIASFGILTALVVPDSVTTVRAYGNHITHIKISPNSNLTTLTVGKNLLTSLDGLTELRKLENLELSYNRIDCIGLANLTNMSNLKELLIYGIKVDKLDADFVLERLPNLRIVELSPNLFEPGEVTIFAERLRAKNVYVMVEGGKLIPNSTINRPATSAPENAVTDATTVVSITEKVANEPVPEQDIALSERVQRLEQRIQSCEHQFKQSIDDHLHTLRMLIVVTICTISLFVAFQIFVFIRNNYTRLRMQTNTILGNGRTRSHEPMLEEVL